MKLADAVRRLLGRSSAARRAEAHPAPPSFTPGSLLAGRSALVTGAGRNIGRAIALEMAREGAMVVFTERDADRAARLEQDLAGLGAPCRGFLLDASDVEQGRLLCSELEAAGIVTDVLVNNAALQVERTFAELEPGDWRRSFEANVVGPLELSRRVARNLTAAGRPGSILFVTSTHQWEPAYWPAYSSSKAALGMLIRELAADLAPRGIRVNGVAPGWVTEERRTSHHSLLHGTTIDPVYVGRAAVALSSEHVSRYTTGAVLVVDAGLSLINSRIAPPAKRP